jgi:PadR family transcriptional regulator PadR
MVKASEPRLTVPMLLALRAMLDDPTREMYGLEICKAAGLPSGTLHPILARLERCGWLESHWENTEPTEGGRPRRRYYRFSPHGAERARAALEKVHVPVPVAEPVTNQQLIPRLARGV